MAAVCAEQGMGSTLHVAAVFLAQALQYDHIFVWDPRGAHIGQEYVDPGCGRGENYTSWDWYGFYMSETVLDSLRSCIQQLVAVRSNMTGLKDAFRSL